MFDMGFTEMMLIGIVALIVIGPERLPGVARTAGKYFGRLKRFMTSVKADVEQELRADELRQILADQQRELNTLKDSITEAGSKIEKEANAVVEAGASLDDSPDELPPHDPLPDPEEEEAAEAGASPVDSPDELPPHDPLPDPDEKEAAAAEEPARARTAEAAGDSKS
jgi:sec-independent protein translocase protein TatB